MKDTLSDYFIDNHSTTRGQLVIISCDSGRYMLEMIKKKFDEHELSENVTYMFDSTTRFADGEIGCRLRKHVGGKDVFIVQALFDPRPRERLEDCVMNIIERVKADPSADYSADVRKLPKVPDVNSNLKELEIVARTARVNGARHVTAVLPYLAYSRQDKHTSFQRENVTAKLVADTLYTAGIEKIITWHVHSPQIIGFYERGEVSGSNFLSPVDFFIKRFESEHGKENVIILSLDSGGAQVVMNVSKGLNVDFGIGSKDRPKKDVARINSFAADLSDKTHVIFIDDQTSTGSSYESGIKVLEEQARSIGVNIEMINAGVSHALLTSDSLEKLRQLKEKHNLKSFCTTDSIPLTKRVLSSNIVEQYSIAPIFSLVINRVHYEMPLQDIFWKPEE